MANGSYDPSNYRQEIRQATYAELVDKIRRDRFPSTSMMDMVENGADEQQLADYLDVLLDKVQRERFPSIDLLNRLTRLT